MMKCNYRFVCVALLSCSFLVFLSCKKEVHNDLPVRIALESYQHLVQGEHDVYLQAMAGYEHMPASYREELKALMAQYVRNELEKNGGIVNISVNSDTIIGERANVFLILDFKDGTKEEISVPLVYDGNTWRLQ